VPSFAAITRPAERFERFGVHDVLAVAIAAAFLALFLVQVAVPAATRLTDGFTAYFTAARLVQAGQGAARFYDDSWFMAQTVQLGPAAAPDIYNLNPPAAALLLLPLAGLDPVLAKAVWTGLNLIFLGVASAGLVWLGRRSFTVVGAVVVAVTLFQPVREEIRLGQAYAFLLLLQVMFCWAYLSGRDRPAGLALGLLLGLKTVGLALPFLLVGQRRGRALLWTALAVGVVVALSLPWLGLAAWLRYVSLLFQVGAHPELAVTAYQSLPGLFLHLFRLDPTWNPSPVADLPALATVLLLASALALVGLTSWLTWRADPGSRAASALAVAAWITLGLILGPATQDYHDTLLLAPIALLLGDWWNERRSWLVLLLVAIGILLVGAPLPYKSPVLTGGSWAILAYPKLYGALALWGVAARGLSQERALRQPGG
jgi:alpha-1,2-mannosyltransferase